MKRKLLALVAVFWCVAAIPMTVWADDRETYTPPPEKGKIYVMVKFAGMSGIVPKNVKITIKWGSWEKSGTFNSGGGRVPKTGFIIRLDHKKNDSVQVTANTSGEADILRIYQGAEPNERKSGNWHYQEW